MWQDGQPATSRPPSGGMLLFRPLLLLLAAAVAPACLAEMYKSSGSDCSGQGVPGTVSKGPYYPVSEPPPQCFLCFL